MNPTADPGGLMLTWHTPTITALTGVTQSAGKTFFSIQEFIFHSSYGSSASGPS